MAAGNVKGDGFSNRAAEQIGNRTAGDATKHIENGHFDPGDRAPERLAEQFVVAAVSVDAEQVFFQFAGVLTDEVGDDKVVEDRMQMLLPTVAEGQAFGAICRSDSYV